MLKRVNDRLKPVNHPLNQEILIPAAGKQTVRKAWP